MKKTVKIFPFLIVIALIVISFLWCASFCFHLLMSLDSQAPIKRLISQGFQLNEQLRSYPQDILFYQQRYALTYPKQLKLAWIATSLLHGVVFIILVKIFSKRPKLYGDARFATYREIVKSKLLLPVDAGKTPGLFAGSAIIVGKIGNRFLAFSGQLFAYLTAPTRSGKGAGVVIPVGLSYADSIVALDIKQELFEITAAYRAMHGHSVYLFNPYNEDGRTACWNPLTYVRRDESLRFNDLNQIALCLIPDMPGDDNFFPQSARNLFIGLGLYLLDMEKNYASEGNLLVPTIRGILDKATLADDDPIPYFTSLLNDNISSLTRQTINAAISSGAETFGSILATLTANLNPWFSSTVTQATSHDDFDLRDVRKKKMTIYLGIMPGDLPKADKLLNLFYTQLIDQNTYELPKNNPDLKYQCLLLMDEATAPGRIRILEKSVSYIAGYNLRLLLIVQSPAQLENTAVYGKEGSRNLLTNIALKILYRPNDLQDAEDYSRRLGKTTVKADTSRSRGGGTRGLSTTETLIQRDLMMPQELMEMDNSREIIFYSQCPHPIWAEKITYFEDPLFSSRAAQYGMAKAKTLHERFGVADLERPKIRQDIENAVKSSIPSGDYEHLISRFLDLTPPVVGNLIGRLVENNSRDDPNNPRSSIYRNPND